MSVCSDHPALNRTSPLSISASMLATALTIATLIALAVLGRWLPGWLQVWPEEHILPMAEVITSAIERFANWSLFGQIPVKDITRAIAQGIEWPAQWLQTVLVDGINHGFGARRVNIVPPLSWLGVAAAITLIGWRAGGWRLALLAAGTVVYLLVFGLWASAMQTLALLAVAVPLGVAIGLALGIVLWRYRRIQKSALVAFDQMQTIPIFAYLAPLIVFFGLGDATAIVATIIFAVPTMIRTTVIGLNLAERNLAELPQSLGCTFPQKLGHILLPAAQSELRVGINQIVMLSFACTVLASLVGTQGLGYDILVALRQLNIGEGLEAGLAVTLLAILLDQLLQSPAERTSGRRMSWRTFTGLLLAVLIVPTLLSLAVPQLLAYPEAWQASTGQIADKLIEWVNVNLYWLTNAVKTELLIHLLIPIKTFLEQLPWISAAAFVALLGYLVGGWRTATLVGAITIAFAAVGLWQPTMLTVYLCTIAVTAAALLGVPIGILAGRHKKAAAVILPIVDTLQTLPPFVYLIPVIMLFGAGDFPAFVAITAYAICPAIRFTALGIRNVPDSLLEAGTQLGMTSWQRLIRVELPSAAPQILLGLNGAIVMGLAMLVVTALIGTKDLGRETVNALAQVNPGQGLTAGLAVAGLAVIATCLLGGLAERRMTTGSANTA